MVIGFLMQNCKNVGDYFFKIASGVQASISLFFLFKSFTHLNCNMRNKCTVKYKKVFFPVYIKLSFERYTIVPSYCQKFSPQFVDNQTYPTKSSNYFKGEKYLKAPKTCLL